MGKFEIFVTVLNIAVILFQLWFFFLTRTISHTLKRTLKDRGAIIDKGKVTPILIWEDGSITYCKAKEIEDFVVGETYKITYTTRVFKY